MLNGIIKFFLENKLVTFLLLFFFLLWGIATAPFDWKFEILPSDPVAVDAIPDLGENQQIIFSEWKGRSPQDIEDQITYPLTTALLGVPGVKTIRSSSAFGFSSIYVIFEEGVDFYWSRSRILEKLNSLSSGTLPPGVQPTLGPDATGLGQIFWYTLEGRDPEGNPTGGWDLQELRSIQDYYVKYGLSSTKGVSEVASIGGYVKEYQIDVDPVAMQNYNIPLSSVIRAVKRSNRDIGAKTIEINKAEYLVRGLGYIKNLEDIENTVVDVVNNTPVRISDIGFVTLGPATRRGVLDKAGAEVVGGVVVSRYGANPLEVINNVKEQIAQISPGLPSRVLEDGTLSKLTIVPFYDRTNLIRETLGTLEEALSLEILITLLVVVIMVMNLRASILIAGLLPVAVLITFIAMRYTGVDANIVALSGIAIAIGTMVDMGIILTENIIRHIESEKGNENRLTTIYRATTEVATAILTAVSTTIISFIPVFTLQAAEGKLFRPLAFTKTFALFAAILLALIIIPALAQIFYGKRFESQKIKRIFNFLLIPAGILLIIFGHFMVGLVVLIFAGLSIYEEYHQGPVRIGNYPPVKKEKFFLYLKNGVIALGITLILAGYWLPLGPSRSLTANLLFTILIVGGLLLVFYIFQKFYSRVLRLLLRHKLLFLLIPAFILLWGSMVWFGFGNIFGFVGNGFDAVNLNIRKTRPWVVMAHNFPGVGKEFMPSLDEGSFLLMPTSMPHAGIEENTEVLKKLDMAVASIPEVEMVVGKLGRVESALDPAPISMYENVINYKSEFLSGEDGRPVRFAVNDEGEFLRDSSGNLIKDRSGEYYRQWRDHIKSPDDIWNEIIRLTNLPGVTSAPKLQPIETRLIMLQSGMRAPMGIKVRGPDLETIQNFGIHLGKILEEVPSVKKEAVFADRVVGKPYLNIDIDRKLIARHGLSIEDVLEVLEVALGGMPLTTTVEGRERYPVRVRYPRELRDDPSAIGEILIPTPEGTQIPLAELAEITYEKGPQVIKSENTFLTSYVLFDKKDGFAEVQAVNDAQDLILKKIKTGELIIPEGVSYHFAGSYENQVRAEKRLSVIVPIVLGIIFLLLYLQFRSVLTSMMVFSAVAVAFGGGFIMIWLYGQPWFMDFNFWGVHFRELFQMGPVNLSVAVWVGFIALFGIATDDGVLMATYLKQSFAGRPTGTISEIREAVVAAGLKRIRPCLMTTATTLLALLPIFTTSGKGSDIMIPMAIPVFGGMAIELISLFIVPVLFSAWQEFKIKRK